MFDEGGNLSSDPLFVDADGLDGIPGTFDDDLRLTALSPAIDAGVNDSLLLDLFDLDADGNKAEFWPSDGAGHMRVVSGGSGDTKVDIGAFEFGAPPIITSIMESPEPDLPSPRSLEIFPNPAADALTASWDLPDATHVEISIFNASGRRIRRFSINQITTGDHIFIPVPDLSPGVYFLQESIYGSIGTVIIIR